jgi:hypothetical protein
MTIQIKDLSISMDINAGELSTVRGGDGRNAEPKCTWVQDFGVAQAACEAQSTWYQTFGFLLP